MAFAVICGWRWQWLWLLLALQQLPAQHPPVHVLQQQDAHRDWEPAQQIPTRRPHASHLLPPRLQHQLGQQNLDLQRTISVGPMLGPVERKRQEQQLLKQQQEQKDMGTKESKSALTVRCFAPPDIKILTSALFDVALVYFNVLTTCFAGPAAGVAQCAARARKGTPCTLGTGSRPLLTGALH